MNDEQGRQWMQALARGGSRAELARFDRVRARALLEQEFAARRRTSASLDWIDAGMQTAAGLALAAILAWLSVG